MCLGLSNKKDSVIDNLVHNLIEICALQETEIQISLTNCASRCAVDLNILIWVFQKSFFFEIFKCLNLLQNFPVFIKECKL